MDHFGEPDVVHTETIPVPEVGKNQVLVRVVSAGVGTWDPELVDGSFRDVEVRFPRVIGSDGAGTVVAAGSRARRFAIGDRVYGWGLGNAKGGFFAEYAAIDETELAPIPSTLSFEEAGALAVSGLTALAGLERLNLAEGDRLAIFGASGGVGHVAVQLAKVMGLRVFGIASQEDGVELVRRLGADAIVEGHSPTLVRELKRFAPGGFDGALVFAGARGWKRALECMRRGAVVAYPNGVEPAPIVPRFVKHEVFDGEDSPAAFSRLNQLVARGPFHVEISRRYPLDAAAQALRDVQHHHVGKLSLEIRRKVARDRARS
ncbi:MAG: NADP-dependent oxidoreductase [Kofleriaceae bacterium]|nr:NADP-dependent oxidoreductase [Kofleriaceae bacterium]